VRRAASCQGTNSNSDRHREQNFVAATEFAPPQDDATRVDRFRVPRVNTISSDPRALRTRHGRSASSTERRVARQGVQRHGRVRVFVEIKGFHVIEDRAWTLRRAALSR